MSTLAWVPTGSETSPCCCCPTSETLDALVVGFSDCGCFQLPIGGAPPKYRIVGHTGITGSHTATLSGPDWVNANIGTVDVQTYSDLLCATPDGDPETFDVSLTIVCGNGIIVVDIAIVSGPGIREQIFSQSGVIDEVIPTQFTCDGIQPALIDSVTVTVP